MIKMGFEFEFGSNRDFDELESSFADKFPDKHLEEYGGYDIPTGYSFHDDDSSYQGCETNPELVTPPLPFDQAVNDCVAILSWMKENNALTSDYCGMHVGMSFIDPETQDKVKNHPFKYTKLVYGLPEITILKKFGRMENEYCRSLKRIVKSSSRYDNDLFANVERILDRHNYHGSHSITLEKLNYENSYVEFRMLGGENYPDRVDEIVEVLNLYKTAYVNILDDSEEYKQKIISNIMRSGIRNG